MKMKTVSWPRVVLPLTIAIPLSFAQAQLLNFTPPPTNAVATVRGPTNITICAAAFDPDGSVTSVEFFEGTTSLGVVPTPPVVYVTNSYGVFPIRSPYCVTWSNAPLGTFTLTAVATDNTGLT